MHSICVYQFSLGIPKYLGICCWLLNELKRKEISALTFKVGQKIRTENTLIWEMK